MRTFELSHMLELVCVLFNAGTRLVSGAFFLEFPPLLVSCSVYPKKTYFALVIHRETNLSAFHQSEPPIKPKPLCKVSKSTKMRGLPFSIN